MGPDDGGRDITQGWKFMIEWEPRTHAHKKRWTQRQYLCRDHTLEGPVGWFDTGPLRIPYGTTEDPPDHAPPFEDDDPLERAFAALAHTVAKCRTAEPVEWAWDWPALATESAEGTIRVTMKLTCTLLHPEPPPFPGVGPMEEWNNRYLEFDILSRVLSMSDSMWNTGAE